VKKRLKILLFRRGRGPGNFEGYLLQDCQDALSSLGHETMVFDLLNYENEKGCLEGLGRVVDNFLPDLAFLFISGNEQISKYLISKKIPYGDWIFDDPLLYSLKEFVSPYGFLFVADRLWIDRLKMQGVGNSFYLPCGVNPNVYRRIRLSREDEERYRCDVSFVGASKFAYYKRHYLDEIKKRGGSLRRLLDEVIRLQIENPLLNTSDILIVAKEVYHSHLNFKDEVEKEFFELGLNFAASSLYRKEIVERLSNFGIRVYGDKGWKSLLGPNGGAYYGEIRAREELVKLYNTCKISIGASLFQLRTAITVRPFQVSACGGFLIDDYRQDHAKLFEIGKEMICYRNKEELEELVGYFLKHPRERREIALSAMDRVLKEHTFLQRMEEAIKILSERFNL
jgi:spore maturation protein CgeB